MTTEFKVEKDRFEYCGAMEANDIKRGLDLVVAQLVQGKDVPQMLKALTAALALVTTVFAPDQEMAEQNRENLALFFKRLGSDMWSSRDDIEQEVTRKVNLIMPYADALLAIKPKTAPEPEVVHDKPVDM